MRPANDLLQVMYCASSSLRACTLKLPSVVLRSAFSSLKVNASFTASALTMPSRTRSWIRRSSSAARRARSPRSEEHTSELQSQFHLVCRLLLEKKNETETQKHDCLRAEKACGGRCYS